MMSRQKEIIVMSTQSSLPSTASNKLLRAQMITRQAKMIFSAYRRDDFADPDNFVLQVGLVLERYPDAVISEVSSPLTGIQRRCKQPPTIADLVEACDAELARSERIRRYSEMGSVRYLPRNPKPAGNVFVPTNAPQYAAMVEKTKKVLPGDLWFREPGRDGIWVPLGWLEEAKAAPASFKRFSKEDLEEIYGP